MGKTGSIQIFVDTGLPIITVTPMGDIISDTIFSTNIELSIDTNIGYWSTNGTIFNEFTTNVTINLLVSNYSTIQYYGASSNSSTATQTVVYQVVPEISISAGPTSDTTTNEVFTMQLTTTENNGYFSTNGSVFEAFAKGATNIIINKDTILKFYGSSDGVHTGSIQTVVYSVIPDVSITAGPTSGTLTNEAFTIQLTTTANNGYFSTNGSAFEAFPMNTKDIIINVDSTLKFYGSSDGLHTSSTQTTHYSIRHNEQIYVSTSGNDANDGKTFANAVLTIQKAVELVKTYSYANVYVEAGTYQQGTGLSNNVAINNYAGVNIVDISSFNLIGGWNAAFDTQNGVSILDGQNSLHHIIWVENISNLTIDGFIIQNGNGLGSSSRGGGIYSINCQSNTINAIVANNTAAFGAGICIRYGSHNTINGTISNNIGVAGGGVFLEYSDTNTISGTVSKNTASNRAGGIDIYGSSYNTITGTVSSNIAIDSEGGGIHLYIGKHNIISGVIFGNVSDSGGGVYINTSYTTVSGIVSNNTAISGGGIFINSNVSNTISGVIIDNFATIYGGGIYIYNGLYNTFSGTISNNIAESNGGGLYFGPSAANNTFTATSIVRWNTVTDGSVGDGGGVYVSSSAGSQTTNAGFIISDNSPDDWAGIAPSAP